MHPAAGPDSSQEPINQVGAAELWSDEPFDRLDRLSVHSAVQIKCMNGRDASPLPIGPTAQHLVVEFHLMGGFYNGRSPLVAEPGT